MGSARLHLLDQPSYVAAASFPESNRGSDVAQVHADRGSRTGSAAEGRPCSCGWVRRSVWG